MTTQERIYIERTEGRLKGIEQGRKEGFEEGRIEERTRFEKRLRELGVPEEMIKAVVSDQPL